MQELDLDKEDAPKMGVSQLDEADSARIVYIEKVSGNNYN